MVPNERLQTLARQVVGGLLWVAQLHFHIGFDLTVLGTTIRRVADSAQCTKDFFLRSNRVIRDLENPKQIIWYHDWVGSMVRSSGNLRNLLTMILFTDAGFGSLGESRSIKSYITMFGIAAKQSDIADYKSRLLTSRSSKISQAPR